MLSAETRWKVFVIPLKGQSYCPGIYLERSMADDLGMLIGSKYVHIAYFGAVFG